MERIKRNEIGEKAYQALFGMETYLKSRNLDTKLLELIRFRVSQLNNCAFCLDMHYKEAIHAGEDPKRLYSLSAWRETPYYSEEEQVLLEFAEALTLLPTKGVSEDLFNRLSEHFSKEQIVDLTLVVAQINTWNRITNVSHTEPGNYKVGTY